LSGRYLHHVSIRVQWRKAVSPTAIPTPTPQSLNPRPMAEGCQPCATTRPAAPAPCSLNPRPMAEGCQPHQRVGAGQRPAKKSQSASNGGRLSAGATQ